MSTPHTDAPPTTGGRPGDAGSPALPPLWSIELLDVLGRRGRFALAIAGTGSLVALLLALVAPGLVAPEPLVGAIVGITALATGIALMLALDALDVRVRGPRHVRSSGGELVALLPEVADPNDAQDLAVSVLSVRTPGTALFLGFAPVGDDATSSLAWTHALAEALARDGATVLLVDLAGPTTDLPGIVEVVRDRLPLERAVSYADGLTLALLGPGPDRIAALKALVTLPTVLPDDVDILLVALPQIVNRSAVNASRILDQVLFVAEANLSSRVELMASLDALRVAGCSPQVVLVDGRTWRMLRPERPLEPAVRTTAVLPVVPLEGGAPQDLDEGVTLVSPATVATAPVAPATTAGTPSVPAAPIAAAPVVPAPVAPVPIVTPSVPVAPAAPSAPEEPVAPAPAAPPEPPLSAGEPSSPLRTVEVLEAAAAATAESSLDATLVDTVPMDRAEVLRTVEHEASAAPSSVAAPAAPAPAAPAPAPAPSGPAPAPPEPTSRATSAPTPTERPTPAAPEELTTELTRDTGPLPNWASVEDEEDLLRTTVQLSVFTDELELRDDA